MNIYDTLITLSSEEESKLSKGFGDLWMIKFFNIYHISAFVNKLEKKPEMKKELSKKYDNEWIQKFIEKFKSEVVFKKINYSYSDLIKFQYKVKMGKKLEKVVLEKEIEEYLKNISVNNELKDTLFKLSQNDYKIGCCSNSIRKTVTSR